MKKTARFLSVILIFAALSTFCSCGTKNKLYDMGLEVISLISEKANNKTYIESYDLPDKYENAIFEYKDMDFSQPKAVFELSFSEEDLFSALSADINDIDDMSEDLKQGFYSGAFTSVLEKLNLQNDLNDVLITSVLNSGKVFGSKSIKENTVYLYTYEDAPPVAVRFTKCEGRAVSVSAMLILAEDFECSSKDEIKESFETISLSVDVTTVKSK